MNAATVIVALIVAALLALVIVKMVRDRKAGKSSCGCSCSMCGNNACREYKKPDKDRSDQ
ncbi:MAG: FeoB-associated Cys-rich membrane protein [Eubacteriaceae bacterium]|nr:FeoB-associated Cys-rich membrane protein [Eubacteriaceae bacterium]